MKVLWTAPALRELEAIGDYIARDSPRASARIVLRIFERVDALADQPEIGRPAASAARANSLSPTLCSSCPIAYATAELKYSQCSMARGAGRKVSVDKKKAAAPTAAFVFAERVRQITMTLVPTFTRL